MELRTLPVVVCLLDQPWAGFLQPGDWVEVTGEPWTGVPSAIADRVVLVRCAAAIAPAHGRCAIFHITGTVDELDLHGGSATMQLSVHSRRTVTTVSIRAPGHQALNAFLAGKPVCARGRLTVNRSGRILYIADHVDIADNNRKEAS